jgi:hypothetical protein
MEGIGLLDGLSQAPPFPAVPAPMRRGGLVSVVASQGIQPRDPLVQRWWRRLQRQGLLQQNPWARRLLLHMWRQGLVARPRPRTAKRLAALLRRSRRMGVGAAPGQAAAGTMVPGASPGVTGLIDAVRYGGFGPRDPRVRLLWRLLQSRGILQRDPWMRRFLNYSWSRGLVRRPRQQTADRFARHLSVRGPVPGAVISRPYARAVTPGVRTYPAAVRPRVYSAPYRRPAPVPYRAPIYQRPAPLPYRAPIRAWRR